jgi:hypothetical protein
MTTARLPASAAGALAAALAHALGSTQGVRSLIIKGPVTSHFGLRPPRLSADIDVLVEPSRYEDYLAALEAAGWTARPEMEASTALSAHSASFTHPGWPTDIDVHWEFPGLLAQPSVAFDALWRSRAAIECATVACDVTGAEGSAIISALHSLRHDTDSLRLATELTFATDEVRTWAASAKDRLARLAEETGAAGPLVEWFAHLGIEVAVEPSDALADWHARRSSGDTFAGQFVAGMAEAGARDRLRLAWITFWPRAEELRAARPEIGPGKAAIVRARFARWGRGIRDMPRALRSLRRSRRGGDA